jgi:polar amino acid transport system substrate-binding protein
VTTQDLKDGSHPNPMDHHMNIDRFFITAFAPTGKLRASINLGNPILANRHPKATDAVNINSDFPKNFIIKLHADEIPI